jgi:hypothetical protein
VVAEIEGVVKLSVVTEALVRRAVPPVSAAYQRKTPAVVRLADNATVPVPQRLPLVMAGAGEAHCACAFPAMKKNGAKSSKMRYALVASGRKT